MFNHTTFSPYFWETVEYSATFNFHILLFHFFNSNFSFCMLFVLVLLWFDAFQIVRKWHTQRVQNHWFCKFGAVLHWFCTLLPSVLHSDLQICTQKPWLANVQLVTVNLISNQKHTALEIIWRAWNIHSHCWYHLDYMFAAILAYVWDGGNPINTHCARERLSQWKKTQKCDEKCGYKVGKWVVPMEKMGNFVWDNFTKNMHSVEQIWFELRNIHKVTSTKTIQISNRIWVVWHMQIAYCLLMFRYWCYGAFGLVH